MNEYRNCSVNIFTYPSYWYPSETGIFLCLSLPAGAHAESRKGFLFNYHDHVGGQIKEEIFMAFFNSAVTILQTLVIALGAGLGIWGATD